MALFASPSHSRQLYETVKTAIAACESAGDISTNLLAAQVLRALHEVSQGLYPAAYYSVGSCIRSCMTLGLHDKRTAAALGPQVDAWTEIEERRRLWWASLILDRYVHAGFTFRPLFNPVLDRSEVLPADDTAWDGGYISPNSLLVMSFGSTATAAPFARLCQAAHLLGKSCQHAEDRFSAVDADYHAQEAYSLGRAASSFLALIEQELADTEQGCKHNLYGAFGLCCSALLSLYYTHCCLDDDALTLADEESKVRDQGIRIELQRFAIAGLATITQKVLDFSQELCDMCEGGMVNLANPLVLNALYQTVQYLQLLDITEKGACEPF
ncbi:hypothetical protein PRZ48_007369 [Zasmidium cellare]|uniref:Xylanolytic transcriptional activator regulatory domain-containing protein n=1 Tax=Zasmidium cellare TaxID=395010 RepID=A0ABR0EJ93_ZASCE|nr:hypothetical protein PRZ48_007369 [Zasmidium cellare]